MGPFTAQKKTAWGDLPNVSGQEALRLKVLCWAEQRRSSV